MKIRTLLLAAAATLAVAGNAAAETSATAPVKANIVTPASIAKNGATELNFGTLSRTGTPAASVVVDQEGARGAVTGFAASGTTDAAEFNITGFPSQVIDVAASMTTPVGTGISVALDTENEVTLDTNGAYLLKVGGTLSIDDGVTVDQAAYEGTMTVTVTYN